MGIINKSRWVKIVIAADNHGDMLDSDTHKQLFSVIDAWKPDMRIHLGDVFNLDACRDGASPEERNVNLGEDIKSGLDFLEEFRPSVLTWGNHDYRIFKRTKSLSAIDRDWAEMNIKKIDAVTKKLKIATYGWGVKQGVYEIAGQKMVHGYSHGLTATTTMGRTYGRCVHAHNHTGDIIWLPTIDGGFAQSIPSMCNNNDMSYQLGQIASFKHISGFGLGLADLKNNLYYPGFVAKTKSGFVMMEPKAL